MTSGRYPITILGHFKDNNDVMSFITKDLKKINLIDYTVSTVLNKVKREVFSI